MKHATRVAQPRNATAVQQVCVDARNLRRDVGAHAEHAPRQLVNQLEGAQIEIMPGAGEQRIHVFQQRRHHQLIAMHGEQIQDRAAQAFNTHGFRRQDIFDVFRQ